MLKVFMHRQQTLPQKIVPLSKELTTPRFFDYAFVPSSLKTIAKLLDGRIHKDIGADRIAQARSHVFSLFTGMLMLPLFSFCYLLRGGVSWMFHTVIVVPLLIWLFQLVKMPSKTDLGAQVNLGQQMFAIQLFVLALITGGAVSPAFPWFAGIISQAALSQVAGQQLRQINQVLLLVVIATLVTFIPFMPNVIPEGARVFLLVVSIFFAVIQVWSGHSIVNGQRTVREELVSVMRMQELETGLVSDESTRYLLKKLALGDSGGRFSVLRLDVPSAVNEIHDNQLMYNKQCLAEVLLYRCPVNSVFAALGANRLVVFFPQNDEPEMAVVIDSLLHSWPQMAIANCGLYEQCRAQKITAATVSYECGVG